MSNLLLNSGGRGGVFERELIQSVEDSALLQNAPAKVARGIVQIKEALGDLQTGIASHLRVTDEMIVAVSWLMRAADGDDEKGHNRLIYREDNDDVSGGVIQVVGDVVREIQVTIDPENSVARLRDEEGREELVNLTRPSAPSEKMMISGRSELVVEGEKAIDEILNLIKVHCVESFEVGECPVITVTGFSGTGKSYVAEDVVGKALRESGYNVVSMSTDEALATNRSERGMRIYKDRFANGLSRHDVARAGFECHEESVLHLLGLLAGASQVTLPRIYQKAENGGTKIAPESFGYETAGGSTVFIVEGSDAGDVAEYAAKVAEMLGITVPLNNYTTLVSAVNSRDLVKQHLGGVAGAVKRARGGAVSEMKEKMWIDEARAALYRHFMKIVRKIAKSGGALYINGHMAGIEDAAVIYK